MNRIEPPLEPEPRHEINLGPKEARRVASYSPWFIWGVTAFWSAFIVVQLGVTGGDWLSALRFGAAVAVATARSGTMHSSMGSEMKLPSALRAWRRLRSQDWVWMFMEKWSGGVLE